MKICFVSFFSPQTSAGGLERYLDTMIKELIKRNVEVHLVTAAYGKEGVEVEGKLTIHKLKAMKIGSVRNKNEGAKKLFNYLKRLVKKEKIDVISAENFTRGTPPSYAFAVNLASMETKVPLVLRVHGHPNSTIEGSLIRDLFWSKIMPVSKNVSGEVYNLGVNVDKLVSVYPAVDTENFRPGLGVDWLRSRIDVGKNEILIMHASRITGSKRSSYLDSKGVPALLKAFSILVQENKNVKLLIATAEPPPTWKRDFDKAVKKIYEVAELAGIKDKVIVQSFKLEEMARVYNGIDIFVMASKLESFGLVYAEAMACGVPVIGTSVGGIPEIIDEGKTGYLVDPEDHVELSKRLEILVRDEVKRKNMGLRGRRIIERRFSLKKTVDNFLGALSSIIGKNGKKGRRIELAPGQKVLKVK
jgi:L-malate glycosyltransferase